MKTAVEWLQIMLIPTPYDEEDIEHNRKCWEQAKEIEKEQAELYAKFAVLNDRSGNPVIPFNEFINIDNL